MPLYLDNLDDPSDILIISFLGLLKSYKNLYLIYRRLSHRLSKLIVQYFWGSINLYMYSVQSASFNMMLQWTWFFIEQKVETGEQDPGQKCTESRSCKGSTQDSGRSSCAASSECSAECGLATVLKRSGIPSPANWRGSLLALEHTIQESEAKVPENKIRASSIRNCFHYPNPGRGSQSPKPCTITKIVRTTRSELN